MLIAGRERTGLQTVRAALYISGLFYIFFLSVLLLLVFALFVVLLNCPYSHPQVLPFSFHSPPHHSGGGAIE